MLFFFLTVFTLSAGAGFILSFKSPIGICVDASGNVYVADSGNHKIRKITPSGMVSTLAGSGTAGAIDGIASEASFNNPAGIAIDASGAVYVTDYLNHKIRKITAAGVVSTYAGSGTAGDADGIGNGALFRNPFGIAIDASGVMY
ncbi:MAG: gluconolaconase, partial [Pedobacter sp.]